MPSPTQLQDDLRGEFRGRLHVDPPTRHLYATDASPFHLPPLAVAIPEDEDDLRTLVKYAHEHALPLSPRGAGTGLSGESLTPGIVLDLSVNFRQTAIGSDTARAGCGVVLADLNAEVAKGGRRFAPNPLSAATCTVGGTIGTNASGPNVFAHGYTRAHTRGLRVVWDNGETATLTPTRQASGADATPQLRTIEIRSQAAALLSANRELIDRCRPATPFHRGGYLLHEAITATGGLDLVNLLVGTEGTLAIVTEATLATVPLPGGVAVAVIGFQSLTEAIRAGLTLRAAGGVVACDVFDQRLLSVAGVFDPGPASQRPATGLTVPDGVAAALIAEFEADSPADALTACRSAIERIRTAFAAAALVEPTATPIEVDRVQQFRKRVTTAAYTATASAATPLSLIEDTAVPGEELLRYVSGVNELCRRAELPAVLHVHPLAGQVQVRPLVDRHRERDRAALWPLADQVYQLAAAVGGTISTRHGTGLTRTPWVAKQFGDLTPLFADLKRVFDPKGILNPGKIVGPDPSRPAWPLWQPAARAADEPEEKRLPLLMRSEAEREAAVERCVGCGDCRVRTPPARMCPTFHATGREAATPRAKANLLRLLTGPGRDESLTDDEARAIADLCVNCKMCRTECPAGADIPTLAAEAKAALHAANGLNRDEWVLARLPTFLRVAGIFSLTANLLLGTRPTRWVIEKLFGLSRKRTLPRVAVRSFLARARWGGVSVRGHVVPADTPPSALKVAYFADTFANHADPSIGEATVAVLRHHGIEVYVPPRQKASGVTALTQGDLDAARTLAAHNVRVLADLIRDGYVVLCSDPTAAVTLTQDYPRLLDEPDARLVAAQTQELTAFLWGLYEAGWLRTDFPRPLATVVGHHVPCHVKALQKEAGEPPGPKLLRLIPGLVVTTIDKSCSGMAGTYGLKASAYATSLRAGRPMLDELGRPEIRYGATECGSCRMQMQEGARKRTLHPVQYLAVAYGLLPHLERRLARPLGKLVTD